MPKTPPYPRTFGMPKVEQATLVLGMPTDDVHGLEPSACRSLARFRQPSARRRLAGPHSSVNTNDLRHAEGESVAGSESGTRALPQPNRH